MRELNELNKIVMQKFSSRQAYTFIKGQYVPIILNNISDESQMSLESRKYYVQSYDFTMLGYLIDEDEFEVKPAIARVSQIMEVDTSSFRQRRKKSPSNPDQFLSNFYYVVGNNSLNDVVDFDANLNWANSNNVESYEVFINGDYFGTDIQRIQISSNDDLRITVIKIDDTKDANIAFDSILYGSTPINYGRVSYSNNLYTLGVQSGATFNISTNLGFKTNSKIKIEHDDKNYQDSIVVSYAPNNGVLIFSGASNVHFSGTGTYDTWNIF
jgi:hypothetical protein